MKTRTFATLCLAATLAAPALAAPSATAVVQEYLTDRDAHRLAEAYALLSPDTKQIVPLKEFTTRRELPADPTVSPAMRALVALVMDTGAAPSYEYRVTGADPADSRVVLVSAQPRGDAQGALTLKIVTFADPAAGGAPRIDLVPSLDRTDPDASRKAREAARAASSMSNLKQIALATLIYAQAHKDRLPDADRWADEVLPYLIGPQASPADRERVTKGLFRDPSAPEGQNWTYAFNRNLSGRLLSSIKDPSNTVLVFESTTSVKNAADVGASVPRPGRHSGGSHYAFADGHVKWIADKATGDAPTPKFTP